MKQSIGNTARKERFYPRPDLRRQILEAIDNGENVLISAPRRVGKTSILCDLVDNPDENVFAVLIETEEIEDSEKFFQEMLEKMLDADLLEGFGKFGKDTKDFFTKWGNKIGGVKIVGWGVDFNKNETRPYYAQLTEFLKELKLGGKKILMMVDEFPTTVEHIHRKHGPAEAQRFLNENRKLRQTHELQHKIKFVYTGSVGLYTAVKKLKAVDRINDLREIKVNALNKKDAETLIALLLTEKTGAAPAPEVVEYILHKIEWWIPFYFQLIVKEIADLLMAEGSVLNEALIDAAFLKVVENGNIYFEPFKSRLHKSFDEVELPFVLKLLLTLKASPADFEKVTDLAVEFKVNVQLADILEILKHDGYIIEDKGQFKFYSPILKHWWK